MTKWCNKTWNEVVETLNSNIYRGLNSNKVQQLQQIYGENVIHIPKDKKGIVCFLSKLKKLWVLIFIISTIILGYFGYKYEGILLGAILILNIGFMTYMELKEYKNLLELEKLNGEIATVIRERKYTKVSWDELVVGDIVILNEGDLVPADIRIIEANSLKVKEGAITGQGYTVEKYHMKIEDEELSLTDMRNILFRSSIIIEGDAKGIVIATGKNTQIACSIDNVVEDIQGKYNLKENCNKIINIITGIGFLFTIGSVIINILMGENKKNILCDFAMYASAFIPVNIFIIIGITSYIVLSNFKKNKMEIKNLSVMENLSQISLICEDKIGVFSEKDMEVEKIYVNEKIINCGSEYIKDDNDSSHVVERLLHVGLLCNDTRVCEGILYNDKNDLTEVAISKLGADFGINKNELENLHERILQIPFDTERRIMTTINKVDDKFRANVKGAVDVLIGKCTHILKNGVEREISDDDIRKIKNGDINLSKTGLYTMAFAYRSFNYEPSLEENIESNLVFVGLMGINNYPKVCIDNLIKKSIDMNIKPVMITEDNKITAEAFGRSIKMLKRSNGVLSGVEMDNMPKEDFTKIIEKVDIFSRISARHKVKIANLYKEDTHSILMSGSRVSDLSYLKIADVSLGTGNSNVVKKLADINTNERDFASLLDAIKLSRSFVERLKKLILFIFICTLSQGGFLLLAKAFNASKSISPLNMIWTSIITVGIGALSLIMDYKEEDIDYRPEVIDKEFLKDNRYGILLGVLGILIVPLMIMLFNTNETAENNIQISYFIMNLSMVIYSLKSSNTYIFKNKTCKAMFILNILCQVILFVLVAMNNINITNKNLMPISLFAIWIIVFIVKKVLVIRENITITY